MTRNMKGALNPIDENSLLKVLARYIGFVTPQLYLLLIFSVWTAQQAWQRNFETLTAIEAQQAQQRQINLQREPLTPADMDALLKKVLRLAPRVKATLSDADGGKAITVVIEKVDDLDAFREALMLVLSHDDGSIWHARELCFGKCENAQARAVLTATRQRIEVK